MLTNRTKDLIAYWAKNGIATTVKQVIERLQRMDISDDYTDAEVTEYLQQYYPTPKMKLRKEKEHGLQVQCIKWFKYQYPEFSYLCFHVPNGGSRNKIEAKRLKDAGVTAGVADVLLLVPNIMYNYACIELKVGKNNPTEYQENFCKAVQSVNGFYAVVRTLEDFQRIITQYLNTK